MELLDALATEYRLMAAAVKMLNTIWMLVTKLLHHRILVIVFKIECEVCELAIFLDDFVENINIEWQSFGTLKLLDELSANRASYSILMMQL